MHNPHLHFLGPGILQHSNPATFFPSLQFKCSFLMLNTNQQTKKTLYISITELNCIIKVVPYEIVNIDHF